MDRALESRDRSLTQRWRAPILLLAPAAVVFVALFIYPQIALLKASLGAPAWTTAHYTHFLFDTYYLGTLLRSLLLGVAVTAITLALGLPMAYWLARTESRWAA